MSIKNKLILFLVICLPTGWIFAVLAYASGTESGIGAVMAILMSFTPAIAAFICKMCAGESIRGLMLLPNLDGNGKTYGWAILIGVLMSVWGSPVVAAIFFPEVIAWNQGADIVILMAQVLLYTAISCVQFFLLMGEEIGWMGFLYPALEKMCGVFLAVLLTGVIRTVWHGGMIICSEEPVMAAVSLLISNVSFGVFLVILTKKSGSVIPASICHAISNTVPGAVASAFVMDNAAYDSYKLAIKAISCAPFVMFAVVCFVFILKTPSPLHNQ